MAYLYLAIATVAEVAATAALKTSDALTHPVFSATSSSAMSWPTNSCRLPFARCRWHSLTRTGHAPARSRWPS